MPTYEPAKSRYLIHVVRIRQCITAVLWVQFTRDRRLYRPRSFPANDTFFDDFANILERVATYASLLIVRDVNIHLDDATDDRTSKFCRLLGVHNLQQHVT